LKEVFHPESSLFDADNGNNLNKELKWVF
jgi:hypothetical protein